MLGNFAEQKEVLIYTLKLQRERGDDDILVAHVLTALSNANGVLGLLEEGIRQAMEALEITRGRGSMADQVVRLNSLTVLLLRDKQLDAAKEVGSQAIDLHPEKGLEDLACQSQQILGQVYHSKGERESHLPFRGGPRNRFPFRLAR